MQGHLPQGHVTGGAPVNFAGGMAPMVGRGAPFPPSSYHMGGVPGGYGGRFGRNLSSSRHANIGGGGGPSSSSSSGHLLRHSTSMTQSRSSPMLSMTSRA